MENVKQAQDSQAWYYDAKHKCIEFAVGDKVWLLSPNIRTEYPSKNLDSKLCYHKLWYKVHWMGYSISKDSWQPVLDLENAPDLVKQFHLHYPSKPCKFFLNWFSKKNFSFHVSIYFIYIITYLIFHL